MLSNKSKKHRFIFYFKIICVPQGVICT